MRSGHRQAVSACPQHQTRTSRLSTTLRHWSSLISRQPTRRAEDREHTMKLYYLAGSCALAPHIALELSGLPYKAIRVVARETDGPELSRHQPARSGSRSCDSRSRHDHGSACRAMLHRGHGSRPTAIARCWNAGAVRSPALDGVPCKYGPSCARSALAARPLCRRRLHRRGRASSGDTTSQRLRLHR